MQMGEALIKGFCRSGVSSYEQISASVRSSERQRALKRLGLRVYGDAYQGGAAELAANSEIIFLGVSTLVPAEDSTMTFQQAMLHTCQEFYPQKLSKCRLWRVGSACRHASFVGSLAQEWALNVQRQDISGDCDNVAGQATVLRLHIRGLEAAHLTQPSHHLHSSRHPPGQSGGIPPRGNASGEYLYSGQLVTAQGL